MNKLLGSNVDVHLKSGTDIISGIMFEAEEDHIYIRNDSNVFIIVPKDNIKYYTSESLHNISQEEHVVDAPTSSLTVYIDNALVSKIPVPPTFNLLEFNDNIMKVVLGDQDVKIALSGKIQKSIEYVPGEISIYTTANDTTIDEKQSDVTQSFSMSGATGEAVSSYLNPSQMVTRLKNVTKSTKEVKSWEGQPAKDVQK